MVGLCCLWHREYDKTNRIEISFQISKLYDFKVAGGQRSLCRSFTWKCNLDFNITLVNKQGTLNRNMKVFKQHTLKNFSINYICMYFEADLMGLSAKFVDSKVNWKWQILSPGFNHASERNNNSYMLNMHLQTAQKNTFLIIFTKFLSSQSI